MKDIKWIFVLYSIAAVLSMCAIGVSVANSSVIGIIISLIVLTFVMGNGFKTKKRMREAGTL